MKTTQAQKHSIKGWAIDDRPREKLLSKNPMALSDSELLAILINNGDKGRSAVDLGKEILQLGGNDLSRLARLTSKDLMKVKGIGVAKAVRIAAALELGRRRQAGKSPARRAIKGSKEIGKHLQALLKDHLHEEFGVVFLNKAHHIISLEVISKGGISGTVVDPRIVMKRALQENATALILFHNHPSGSLIASPADKQMTKTLVKAAATLDIRVLDHIIVSDEGYFSFADFGYM